MTKTSYAGALSLVLGFEGGKVDDPRDPGGRTNSGVTQRVYDSYRQRKGLAAQDVYRMTSDERDEIYRLQYWDKVRGDDLPEGIDLALFDGAVNSGPVQSIKWLQRALGVAADGMIGEVTLAAAEAYPDHDLLIGKILDRRMAYLEALKTWKTYGHGWTNRVDHLKTAAQALATGSVGPESAYYEGGQAKALISDAKKALPVSAGTGVAGGGGMAALLSGAQSKIEPYVGTLPGIDKAVAGLAIAGAALMLGGGAYSLYANRHNTRLADALDLPTGASA